MAPVRHKHACLRRFRSGRATLMPDQLRFASRRLLFPLLFPAFSLDPRGHAFPPVRAFRCPAAPGERNAPIPIQQEEIPSWQTRITLPNSPMVSCSKRYGSRGFSIGWPLLRTRRLARWPDVTSSFASMLSTSARMKSFALFAGDSALA